MSFDPFTERLSDYIDGIDAGERAEVEAHLAGCATCRDVLRDLRAVRREARSLPRIEPPERVWESLSAKLSVRDRSVSRQSRFHSGMAVAAALVLGTSLWIALGSSKPEPQDPAALADLVTEELRAAESHYENAITGLEQIISQNEGTLPVELNQTLEENLDLIEATIAESRSAIATNPQSPVAQESLLEAFRRKVNLLQNTILLINEVRKGEGQNALDIIDEIRESDDPSNPI